MKRTCLQRSTIDDQRKLNTDEQSRSSSGTGGLHPLGIWLKEQQFDPEATPHFKRLVRIKKALLVIAGMVSLFLGILGIVVPGLPTTPFMLLSAALFVKSSPRLYNWLIRNKYFGRYIENYRKRKGMTLRQKTYAIALMWVMITISAFFLVHSLMVRIIIVIAGLIGTVVMGFIVPRVHDNDR